MMMMIIIPEMWLLERSLGIFHTTIYTCQFYFDDFVLDTNISKKFVKIVKMFHVRKLHEDTEFPVIPMYQCDRQTGRPTELLQSKERFRPTSLAVSSRSTIVMRTVFTGAIDFNTVYKRAIFDVIITHSHGSAIVF